MLICFLACARAGHAYIPVDVSMAEKKLEAILVNSGAEIILNTSEIELKFLICLIKPKDELVRIIEGYNGKKPDLNSRVKGEDVFYTIYTSGSIGSPKGVQITKNNLQSFTDWSIKIVSQGKKVFMNQAPFSFDLSVMDMYLSLISGLII